MDIVVESMDAFYYVGLLPLVVMQHPHVHYDMAPCVGLAVSVGGTVMCALILRSTEVATRELEEAGAALGWWVRCTGLDPAIRCMCPIMLPYHATLSCCPIVPYRAALLSWTAIPEGHLHTMLAIL